MLFYLFIKVFLILITNTKSVLIQIKKKDLIEVDLNNKCINYFRNFLFKKINM